jgi:hypothetical protein
LRVLKVRSVSAFLTALVLIVGVVGCGDGSGYHVTWSPPKVSAAISPGGSWEGSVSFISDVDSSQAGLSVAPELEAFVDIYPQSFSNVVAGAVNTFQVSIAIPPEATVGGTYEGTIGLTVGGRACPETSEVRLYVAPPLDTTTEQSYNETMELETEAWQLFHESEQSSGTGEARQITVDFLNEQAEVFDAGVSDDGSIWIAYKTGLDAILPTSPPGTLGSGVSSLSYEMTQGSLQLMSGCVGPEARIAILLWPLCSDPAYQPKDGSNWTERMTQIRDMLAANGYEVTCARDAEVTVDLLKSMYQYGIVDFFTHGSEFMSSQVMLETGEKTSYSSFVAHLDDIVSHRLARRSVVEGVWMIRPSFVEYYAAQPYPNSLVDVTACYGLANPTMANAFLENGAYVYCGWSGETRCILNQGLYEELTQGKSLGETYIEWVDKGWTTCNSSTWSYYPYEHGDLCLLANAGEQVVLRMELINIPATLTFQQDFMPDFGCEYEWGATIDVDNNAATGDDEGCEVLIILISNKQPGSEPYDAAIDEGTRHDTYVWDENDLVWMRAHHNEMDVAVDYASNTITMVAPKAWEELAGLNENSRFQFHAFCQIPEGIGFDETSYTQGLGIVDDPIGDGEYDFTDIVQCSLSVEVS